MWSDNVTVCIFCYNDEKRLEQTVKNFVCKFEILVIDNFSTDHTLDVCKKNNVDYVQIANHGFFLKPSVMNAVWDHVKTDYILIEQCSEYVPDELYPDMQK